MRDADVNELVDRLVEVECQPLGEFLQHRGAVDRKVPAPACIAGAEQCLQAPSLIVVDVRPQDVRRVAEQRQIGQLPGGELRVFGVTDMRPANPDSHSTRTCRRTESR